MKKRKHNITTTYNKYYNNFSNHIEYPDISLYEMMEKNSLKRPSLIAYNYFGKKSTFMELLNNIEKCAKALKSIGIMENDRVTICMPNIPEAIISFYAINKIGATANMIHPLSGEKEIKYYLNISKSKFLIAIDLSWDRIKNIIQETNIKRVIITSAKNSMPVFVKIGYTITKNIKIDKSLYYDKLLSWKEFIKLGENYKKGTKVVKRGKDEAVILYSGGTSGYPKGVVLSNLNFNSLSLQSIEACGCLKEKDKVLSIMPIFHGFGLGVCIHTVLNFGGCAIILPQFSAKTFNKLLNKYKPNVIAGVPTLYEALLNNKKTKNMDLSYLKCVISGGDTLIPSLKERIDKFLKKHGANIQIREGYGLTECVTGTCLMPENHSNKRSVGIPYPDTYYKIVKPNTEEELNFNEDGEIVLSGPSVMIGYLENPEETKKALRKHKDGKVWLHTGDLGYIDKEGFVYFKQRIKRMIVSSGFNIYPQYIESVINNHPNVLNSCVIAKKHPYKQEVAKAFVVLKNEVEPSQKIKENIMSYCKKELAKYSLPAEIEFINELPKTLIGKIDYTKLMEEKQNEK